MANIINGTDTGSGGLITTGDSSDELQLQTAETARVTLTNTAVVVNEDGNDVDFRVEGDAEANLLFVDAGNDRVGIGTSTPTSKLDVYDSASLTASFSSDTSTSLTAYRASTDNSGSNIIVRKTRGTIASPSTIATGDGLGTFLFQGYGGTTNRSLSGIRSFVETYVSDSDISTDLRFYNSSSGAAVLSEKMRLTSDGYLRMASGSGGIQFNGDTAAANALDDYEEGTWTPEFGVISGSATYTTQNGTYVKIGRQVTCNFWIVVNVSSSLITSSVQGLPFTSSASVEYSGASLSSYETGAFSGQCNVLGLIVPNSLSLQLRKTASATSAPAVTNTTITNGTTFTGSFTYFV